MWNVHMISTDVQLLKSVLSHLTHLELQESHRITVGMEFSVEMKNILL